MTSLLLVRHGQIKANRLGRWHGSTDSPLTWRGRRQAKRTARHIRTTQPAVRAIYSSPLTRCRDTAGIIADSLGLEVEVHHDLREYAIGEWEGKTHKELATAFQFVELATGDHHFAPPGGETLREVADRIVSALEDIHRRHVEDERIMIVGHGAAMAVALAELIDANPGAWTNYQFSNCSLTELVLSPSPYVKFFNTTLHL
jgi:phosphoserine phosphatase